MEEINIKKLISWSIFIIIIGLMFVCFFFMIDGCIPLGSNLDKSNWLSFTGNYLGGIVGGIIAIIGVYLTLKSNNSTVEKQINSAKMESIRQIENNKQETIDLINSNKEIMLEQIRLQHIPLLDSRMINPSYRHVISQIFNFNGNRAEAHRWKMENIDETANYKYGCFSLLNIGNGSAININITIRKIVEIDGQKDLKIFLDNPLHEVYEKIKTINYDLDISFTDENGNWLLYTEFTLAKEEEQTFLFKYQSIQDEFTLLDVEYCDLFGNKYLQKIMLIFSNNEVWHYPISKTFMLT